MSGRRKNSFPIDSWSEWEWQDGGYWQRSGIQQGNRVVETRHPQPNDPRFVRPGLAARQSYQSGTIPPPEQRPGYQTWDSSPAALGGSNTSFGTQNYPIYTAQQQFNLQPSLSYNYSSTYPSSQTLTASTDHFPSTRLLNTTQYPLESHPPQTLTQSNTSLAAQESIATSSESRSPEETSAIEPFSGARNSFSSTLSVSPTDSKTSPEDITKDFDALAVRDSFNPGVKPPSTRQTHSDAQQKHSRHKDKDKPKGSDEKEKRSRHRDKNKPKSSSSARNRPTLDPEYQLADSSEFKIGRVLRMLWSEPLGENDRDIPDYRTGATYGGWRGPSKYGEMAYHTIRRFIIVNTPSTGHSLCLPILTYGLRGTAKPGVKPEDHAIVYTGSEPPRLKKGEAILHKTPIRIKMDNKSEKLAEESRLNYAKISTVEHNSKVCFIGKVHKDSKARLLATWKEVAFRVGTEDNEMDEGDETEEDNDANIANVANDTNDTNVAGVMNVANTENSAHQPNPAYRASLAYPKYPVSQQNSAYQQKLPYQQNPAPQHNPTYQRSIPYQHNPVYQQNAPCLTSPLYQTNLANVAIEEGGEYQEGEEDDMDEEYVDEEYVDEEEDVDEEEESC